MSSDGRISRMKLIRLWIFISFQSAHKPLLHIPLQRPQKGSGCWIITQEREGVEGLILSCPRRLTPLLGPLLHAHHPFHVFHSGKGLTLSNMHLWCCYCHQNWSGNQKCMISFPPLTTLNNRVGNIKIQHNQDHNRHVNCGCQLASRNAGVVIIWCVTNTDTVPLPPHPHTPPQPVQ